MAGSGAGKGTRSNQSAANHPLQSTTYLVGRLPLLPCQVTQVGQSRRWAVLIRPQQHLAVAPKPAMKSAAFWGSLWNLPGS
jgi:hypothetical protein